MNKLGYKKRLSLFACLSALVIVAGIVVFAFFGFHRTAETATVEVSYDSIVKIDDKEDDLISMVESSLSEKGLKFTEKQVAIQRDTTSLGETGDTLVTYSFGKNADRAAIESAAESIRQKAEGAYGDADIFVAVHTGREEVFTEAAWRGAIALAVAAIVVLVYVGFRYGFACAIAGLIGIVHDAALTLALFALTRIPVYAYAPLLFAGMAAVFSLILWILQCSKMRSNFKDPSYQALTAEEAIGQSCKSSFKLLLCFILPFAAAFILLGAVAAAGVRLFFLPALLPLAVGVYSSLLLSPCVLVPFKSKFDRLKASKKRYSGKKKAEPEAAE